MILRSLMSGGQRGFSLKRWIEWLDISDYGGESVAGVNITHGNVLGIADVYACVRKLSEGISTLPCILYRYGDDGASRKRAREHPIYKILHHQPHPYLTAVDFWDYTMQSLLLRGNAYARKIRGNKNQLIALVPLHPDRMEPKMIEGDLHYEYRPDRGEVESIHHRDLFRVRGPLSKDGLRGMDVVQLLRDPLGLSQDEFSSAMMKNGARIGGLLHSPTKLEPAKEKELREGFSKLYSGIDKAYRTAVLSGGIEFKPIQFSPEQQQFLENRKFSVEVVSRIFNIPPHKISHLYHATFSNIEHQSLEYVIDSIRPWLVRIEQAIRRDLIEEDDEYTAEFLVDALLRGDIESRTKSYATGRQWGWLSANDVLRLENQNPIGPEGDLYINPLNMVPAYQMMQGSTKEDEPAALKLLTERQGLVAGATGEEPSLPEANEPEQHNATHSEDTLSSDLNHLFHLHSSLLNDAFTRILHKELRAIRHALRKENDPQCFESWLSDFYEKHHAIVMDVVRPIFQASCYLHKLSDDTLNGYVDGLAHRYCNWNHNTFSQRNGKDLLEQLAQIEANKAFGSHDDFIDQEIDRFNTLIENERKHEHEHVNATNQT